MISLFITSFLSLSRFMCRKKFPPLTCVCFLYIVVQKKLSFNFSFRTQTQNTFLSFIFFIELCLIYLRFYLILCIVLYLLLFFSIFTTLLY